ncbi:MAG TPA: M20/M25/M40 family metallo-hydrolase [Candidatus Fournierella merdigallinarum]|nr:M20/M25/M40 family metallo-hydrolase [Candidatus Fournierella merdigallinarum]
MNPVWILWAVGGLVLLVLALVAVAAVRAARMKPTAAVTAQFPEADMARAQGYAEKLAELVRCETVSCRDQADRRKFSAFHKLLRRTFPRLHRAAEIMEFDGSLLYKITGTAPGQKPPILLMSHQDVVPAEGEWPHGPFSGDIADGAVWGRGTVDTKGSLFCIMQSVEELLESGWQPECDVYIASSCTEEWSGDGAPATAAWLKEHGVHLGLLLDEGGMIMEGPMAGVRGRYGMVGVVEKGYADVKLVAKDEGGHASAPPRNTALARLAKLICRVEKHYPFRARFSPTLREMFRRMAPNMKFGMRLALGNLWLFEPLLCLVLPRVNHLAAAMMRTTCAFTTAKGSDGLNVLPQEAYVTANMRCIPHQPTDESITVLEKLAKKYGVEAQVIYKDQVPPVASYQAAPFRLLERTMARVYPGYDVCPYIMTGGTDARFYKEVTDNALRFAPLEINHQQHASIHAAAENLSVLALPPAVDFYKLLLEDYCTLEEGRRPEGMTPARRASRAPAASAPQAAPEAPDAAPEAPDAPAQSAAAPAVSEAAPAKKPAARKPAARKPAARKPAAKKAAPKKAAEGGAADGSAEAAPAEKAPAKKPAAKKPAAKKAAPKKAAEAPAPAPGEAAGPTEAEAAQPTTV